MTVVVTKYSAIDTSVGADVGEQGIARLSDVFEDDESAPVLDETPDSRGIRSAVGFARSDHERSRPLGVGILVAARIPKQIDLDVGLALESLTQVTRAVPRGIVGTERGRRGGGDSADGEDDRESQSEQDRSWPIDPAIAEDVGVPTHRRLTGFAFRFRSRIRSPLRVGGVVSRSTNPSTVASIHATCPWTNCIRRWVAIVLQCMSILSKYGILQS